MQKSRRTNPAGNDGKQRGEQKQHQYNPDGPFHTLRYEIGLRYVSGKNFWVPVPQIADKAGGSSVLLKVDFEI